MVVGTGSRSICSAMTRGSHSPQRSRAQQMQPNPTRWSNHSRLVIADVERISLAAGPFGVNKTAVIAYLESGGETVAPAVLANTSSGDNLRHKCRAVGVRDRRPIVDNDLGQDCLLSVGCHYVVEPLGCLVRLDLCTNLILEGS